MNIIADDIGVDAGLIIVADLSYLKDVPSPDKKELKRLGKVFDVPKGKYEVFWYIDETCEGDIKGINELKVTSGKIFVCDPCYCIGKEKHEDWMEWLEATEYGHNIDSDKAFSIYQMGGDGCYKVRLSLVKK